MKSFAKPKKNGLSRKALEKRARRLDLLFGLANEAVRSVEMVYFRVRSSDEKKILAIQTFHTLAGELELPPPGESVLDILIESAVLSLKPAREEI